MIRSTERILTTHVGSLARPTDLLDLMKARLAAGGGAGPGYDERLSRAVAAVVKKQAEVGIDIVTDGEMSKAGFFTYVRERLDGYEARPGQGPKLFAAEREAFPEYYEVYFGKAMLGGAVAPIEPLFCAGPVAYKGHALIAKDIANLRAALAGTEHVAAFLPSVAPSGVGHNDHYKTEEEYLFAVAEALREEYLAIVEAGFLLQIDDPFLADVYADPTLEREAMDRRAALFVEATNHALRGIPPEQVRFHTCYGINEGPRVHEAALCDLVGHMLKVNAGAYSFEGANCRHEHEYHLWESVKLPEGKAIIPGVVTHAHNIVEHPLLIAERIERYAKLVGRENVMVAPDCGFSSQATYKTEVEPKVMWTKLAAMVEGARIASDRLWAKAA